LDVTSILDRRGADCDEKRGMKVETCVEHEVRNPRADWLTVALVALLTFGVYLKTLFPGLGGGGDSAKFQYVGSVLGTPHPPGYPLYVLVSFCFAQIPIGPLAWRINAMSAFFATMSAVVCLLVLRRLGVGRVIAACIALSFAFDHALWAFAVRAEVYSLTGALTAVLVLCALGWHTNRRDRDLYLMVAIFALSLGNHLTAAAVAPALIALVLLTDRRAIRARTILVSTVIVIAGLCQYGFILLRTAQNAPYLEARASNLGELFAVMRASRFSNEIFAFSIRQLIVERIPELWHLAVGEFTPIGILVALTGIAALIVNRITIGVLLIVGAAGILFLTLNVGATDAEGFLIPAFVLIWIVAGIGLGWLSRLGGAVVKHGASAAMVVALVLPMLQLARNYRVNDHHRRTYEIQYFDALFDRLEAHAAFVTESYAVDQLVLYKLAGEHADRGRTIGLITRDVETVRQRAATGFTVYAFAGGRTALESHGFRFEPIQLSTVGEGAGAPLDMSALPLFRLAKVTTCHDIGNAGWQDITDGARDGRLLVRIDNYRPFESVVVLYTGQQSPATTSPLLAASHGPEAPSLAVTTFPGADPDFATAVRRDALPQADRLQREAHVQRIELKVNDHGDFSWSALDLGGRPDVVLARASVDLNNPRRASLCGWSGRDLFESGLDERLPLGPSGENSFGAGWHGPEISSQGEDFRWTSAREAEVLIPLTRLGTVTVRVRAAPFIYPGSSAMAIALKVNAKTLPERRMHPGPGIYEWSVPAEVWHQGFNRLAVIASDLASPATVGLSSDTRLLGVAVSEMSLRLTPDENNAPR
jgi:transmembrane protein TMEM260 (protein O-mannosyltransferase)